MLPHCKKKVRGLSVWSRPIPSVTVFEMMTIEFVTTAPGDGPRCCYGWLRGGAVVLSPIGALIGAVVALIGYILIPPLTLETMPIWLPASPFTRSSRSRCSASSARVDLGRG